MAHGLAAFLIEGYINNTRRHGTHGYLFLMGYPSLIRFELAGDPGPTLAGRAIRFRPQVEPADTPTAPRGLAPLMAGATGAMDFVLTPESPDRPTLSLEWFCQNGRLQIELVDPLVMLERGDPLPSLMPPVAPGAPPPAPVAIANTVLPELEEEAIDIEALSEGARLAGLLDHITLDASEGSSEEEERPASDDEAEIVEALKEQLAFFLSEENGESVGELLRPQRLPDPDTLDEAQAEKVVKGLIAEMATLSLGIHLCPHADYRTIYRWLLDEIVPDTLLAPSNKSLNWVFWQSYGEFCPQCLAENGVDVEETGDGGDLPAPEERPDGP